MSKSALIVELRMRAIETLRESTEMFKQARSQRKTGDLETSKETDKIPDKWRYSTDCIDTI